MRALSIYVDKNNKKIQINNTSIYKFNIKFKDANTLIIGYYQDLDNISEQEFIKKIINNTYTHLYSNFLIVYENKSTKSVKIINSPNCGFPFYYTDNDDFFYGTSSITDITEKLDETKGLRIDEYGVFRGILNIHSAFFHDTVFENITKLLPYQIIEIDANFKIQKIGEKIIIDRRPSIYKDINEVETDYTETLNYLFKNFYAKYIDETTVFDLSSGLDSTLVAYNALLINSNIKLQSTFNFSIPEKPESLEIINKWLDMHKVKDNHKYIDLKEQYNAPSLKDIFDKDYAVMTIDHYAIDEKYKKLSGLNLFTGNGGDDVFSFANNTYTLFTPYMHFLTMTKYLQRDNIEKFFNGNFIEKILDFDYSNCPVIDLEIANNATYYYEVFFRPSLKYDVGVFHPLLDRRLAKFHKIKELKGIPTNQIRKSVLKSLINNVYLPEQFEKNKNQNYPKLYKYYLINFTTEYLKLIDKLHPALYEIIDIDYLKQSLISPSTEILKKHSATIHSIFSVNNYLKHYESTLKGK